MKSKPIRKRNKTSAMIHSKRPKQNGGKEESGTVLLRHVWNTEQTLKTKSSSSSIFLSTKDSGSQDVLCTLKPFRLCIVVLMFVPSVDSVNSWWTQNSYCLGWLSVFWRIVFALIYKCLNDSLLQNVDTYKGTLILPYGDLISNYFDWLVRWRAVCANIALFANIWTTRPKDNSPRTISPRIY